MKENVWNEIKREKLIEEGDIVLVALSGGADSVCLLLVLDELRKTMPFELRAVHVEHGIRGESSRNDAAFVEKLCEDRGIPCRIFHEDVPAYADANGIGLEEAARDRRYACFAKAMEECRECFPGCNVKVAVAHHARDNAETILFQMVRGSGLSGLCGMQYQREFAGGQIIRPLLAQMPEEMKAYLDACGQSYCTDETNEDTGYSRNRIRHQVLPQLEQINGQAVQHINQCAKLLQGMEDFLNEEVERLSEMYVAAQPDGVQLYPGVWEEGHEMAQQEIIHRAIGSAAGSKKDITAAHVEAVSNLYDSQVGRYIELPYGLTAERNYHGIWIGKKKQ